jgi:hypothetical protein
MIKIVFFVLIIIALLMLFFYSRKASEPVMEKFTPAISDQTFKISDSEDIKGLGYSGQNKIVSNSKQQLFITYRKKVNEQYSVFVSRLGFEGGKFKIEKTVNVSNESESLPSQRVGSLFVDAKDIIHLTWYGEDASGKSGRQINYSRSNDNGESWSKPVIVSFVEGFDKENLWQEHPAIVTDNKGAVYIAWEGKDKTHSSQQIKFSKSIDGEHWSDWKNILPGGSSQSRPNILIDSKGNLFIVAYSRNGLENQQIWLSKSENQGESWSDWQKISSANTDSRHVDAVIDKLDRVHISWRQQAESKKPQIYYSIYKDGQSSSPLEVAPGSNNQFFPQIGLGADNEVYIAWSESTEDGDYPEDDPQEGDSYISGKKPEEENFKSKALLSQNALYPNLWLNSFLENQTFAIFSELDQSSFPVIGKLITRF